MLSNLAMFLVVIALSSAQTIGIDSSGVVDEIVVTAPRYENEDIAWMGLMPEVICIGFGDRLPLLVHKSFRTSKKEGEDEWRHELFIIERGDFHIITNHN